MTKYRIFRYEREDMVCRGQYFPKHKKIELDIIEADSLEGTPAGFALNKDMGNSTKIIYTVPHGCGAEEVVGGGY